MFCMPFIAKPRSPAGGYYPSLRFYMGMIVDMLLAVAMEALAAGAVPKFQIGMGHISATADGAFVIVGRFDRSGGCLIRAGGGEGYDLWTALFALFATEQPPGICLPGDGDEI